MSYQTRAYDDDHGQPVAVLVVTGTHDVSRLINTLAGSPAVIEQLQTGQKLLKQVRRHNGGRAALELLAAHGGPDFTPDNTTIKISSEAELQQLRTEREQIRQALQPLVTSAGGILQQAIAHLDQAWPEWRAFAEAASEAQEGGDRG